MGGGLREEGGGLFLRLRLRYIQLIKFMCLLVEMCELLVNLRCVVTKVIHVNK